MKLSLKLMIILLSIFFISCQKDEPLEDISPVTDIDGNVYKTVVIGEQIWMAENLRVTKFNDGTPIEYAQDWSGEWAQYCWYDHDESFNTPYGALYNLQAVQSGKLAPRGWRIPNYDDWKQLEETLGGKLIAGGKLKVREPEIWIEPNKLVDPNSGFNAYPSGLIGTVTNYQFKYMGESTTWWVTESSSEPFYLDFSLTNASTQLQSSGGIYSTHSHFLSVRCIKDTIE